MNKLPSISEVVENYLCSGCGACFAVCRQHAIHYRETVGGYIFPVIDKDKCNHCGVCYQICPGIKFNQSLMNQLPHDPFVGNILSCHVGRATDNEIFMNSQSGGVVTGLLVHLLMTRQISGAIVATMQSGVPPRGKPMLATNREELMACQKSKYVPIPILTTIPQLENIEGPIAIVGLPCHMHGLTHIFDLHPRLKSKIILKIGLVCDRVLTNAAVDFLGKQATSSPVTDFIFRDKRFPRYPGNVVATDVKGIKYVLNQSVRMMIKDFFTPVRCRLCFDKLNIFSDITLGDPHGLSGVDRDMGETMLIARTSIGQNAIDNASGAGSILLRPQQWQDIVHGQDIVNKKLQWHSYSQAWKNSKRTSPEYYGVVNRDLSNDIKNERKFLQNLLYSMQLDRFDSREELLTHVASLLKRKTILNYSLKPLRFGKRLIKKMTDFR